MSETDTDTTPIQDEQPTGDLDLDVQEYQLGVQTLYIYTAPGQTGLYKTAGRTTDAEEMVAHDGPVIINGTFCHVDEYEGRLRSAHPNGGRLAAPRVSRLNDRPGLLLTEVERTDV